MWDMDMTTRKLDYYHSQRHRLNVPPLSLHRPLSNLPAKFLPRPKWPHSFVVERPGIFDSVLLYLFQHDPSSVGARAASIECPSVTAHEILELVQRSERLQHVRNKWQ